MLSNLYYVLTLIIIIIAFIIAIFFRKVGVGSLAIIFMIIILWLILLFLSFRIEDKEQILGVRVCLILSSIILFAIIAYYFTLYNIGQLNDVPGRAWNFVFNKNK